jgi:hypothetical protein
MERKINSTVRLTLKFKVEEKTNHCKGCWGGNPATENCSFLHDKIGVCFGDMRKDKKGIIYKLIR